ncbi:MAG: FKBP-type peptidyl-prolyl cis-trans isomerase [Candidatus Hydrothermarchaeota archaeon]
MEYGDVVKVNFSILLEDGEVFETTYEDVAKKKGIYASWRKYVPLVFKAGIGQVIEGLDKAVIGMRKGEEKSVRIPPEEGYGHIRPELIQTVPMDMFRKIGVEPMEGMIIDTSEGYAKVIAVTEEEVELDLNHPLAGKTVIFEIVLEDIVKEKAKEQGLVERGTYLLRMRRFEEALEFFDKALNINPEHGDAWNKKGVALGMMEKFEEALACFDRALEINPQDREALSNRKLALSRIREGK